MKANSLIIKKWGVLVKFAYTGRRQRDSQKTVTKIWEEKYQYQKKEKYGDDKEEYYDKLDGVKNENINYIYILLKIGS